MRTEIKKASEGNMVVLLPESIIEENDLKEGDKLDIQPKCGKIKCEIWPILSCSTFYASVDIRFQEDRVWD